MKDVKVLDVVKEKIEEIENILLSLRERAKEEKENVKLKYKIMSLAVKRARLIKFLYELEKEIYGV